MKNSKKVKPGISEEEIDRIVVDQAMDDSKWEDPIAVSKSGSASLTISPALAARAAFLARIHRAKGLDEWLTRIIQERIELEESAFNNAKQEISARDSA